MIKEGLPTSVLLLSMTSTFRLNRFPKGCDADHSNYVSIFINQVSGPPVWVKYAISLLESQSLHRSPFVHNTRRGSVQFVVDRRSSSRGTLVFKCYVHIRFLSFLSSKIAHRDFFFVKSQRSLLDFLHLTSFSIIKYEWIIDFFYDFRLEKIYIARSHHGSWGCTTS